MKSIKKITIKYREGISKEIEALNRMDSMASKLVTPGTEGAISLEKDYKLICRMIKEIFTNKQIKITEKIHPGYQEVEQARKRGFTIRQIFGKYQYFYESSKGKISLISLPGYLEAGENRWEIYSLKGNLFEDVKIFKTKKEAEKRIKKIIT